MKFNKEKYLKKISEFEKLYNEMVSKYSFKIPKPINLQEEKKKFFMALADDRVYNPQIKYEKYECNLQLLEKHKKKIRRLMLKNSYTGIRKLYRKRLETKLIQIKYHLLWGSPNSTKYIVKYWGKPDRATLRKAIRYCREYKREKVRFIRITPKKVGTELKKEVKRLTGNDINVIYHDMAAKINIEPSQNLIEINPNETFTTLDLERLKTHEIAVHYVRYYNASKWKTKLLEGGTSNYLETEEGLAAYAEYIKGLLSKAQMFVYAGRVIATYYATKKSFYEVFEILKYYGFTDKVAFSVAYRSKRNLRDTSEHGGFTKDYVYFKGFYKVVDYVKNHDIRDLFIGKIHIKDIKSLRSFINHHKDEIEVFLDEINSQE